MPAIQRIQLLIEEIKDLYTKQNFTWLREFVNREDILGSQFKFFELTFNKAEEFVKIPHDLKFQPKDIILSSVTGDASGDFNLHIGDTAGQSFNTGIAGFLSYRDIYVDPRNTYTEGVTWDGTAGTWVTDPDIISPITGLIEIALTLRWNPNAVPSTGEEVFFGIFLNGAWHRIQERQYDGSASADRIYKFYSTMIDVEKGDSIQIYFDNNTSATVTVEGGDNYHNLRIRRADNPVDFHYDQFTNEHLVMSTSGPCTVRFFAGQFKKGGD